MRKRFVTFMAIAFGAFMSPVHGGFFGTKWEVESNAIGDRVNMYQWATGELKLALMVSGQDQSPALTAGKKASNYNKERLDEICAYLSDRHVKDGMTSGYLVITVNETPINMKMICVSNGSFVMWPVSDAGKSYLITEFSSGNKIEIPQFDLYFDNQNYQKAYDEMIKRQPQKAL